MTQDPPLRASDHLASRIEDVVDGLVGSRLRNRGWRPAVVPYTGYGTTEWVRVLARVQLAPPDAPADRAKDARGWRAFLSASSSGVPVHVRLGDETHVVESLREGYVDVRLPVRLPAGWGAAELSVDGSRPVKAPLRIVGETERVGLLSDIDDTVIVTMLPRPALAFWNAFVVRTSARRPVPGMAELYRQIVQSNPGVVVVYLSTGAWNTAPTISDFLDRHGFPAGPMLMTDWGPTRKGWFRSGAAHKRAQLRRLMEELPQVRWLLVGDDGQHDPTIYAEVASAAPEAVLGVAIRQLSTTEQVLSHGTPMTGDTGESLNSAPYPSVSATDGHGLREQLARHGVLEQRG